MTVNLSDKKILLIDDFAEFRFAVRRMIEQLGAISVDSAGDGEKAAAMLGKQNYDLVLSDYNLGDGKDGQQVLEEARYYGHLRHTTVFIMVTAENTPEMVMGAIEYSPDAYLTKPFNKEFLHNRLDKIYAMKQELAPIDRALDVKQYDRALQLCDTLFNRKTRFVLETLKAKSEALLSLGRFTEAGHIFKQVISLRKQPWALLGLGRTHFYLKEYDQARTVFSDLIALNENCIPAYDWLARTLSAMKRGEEALRILTDATKRSPKAILRQQSLSRLAIEHQAFDVAERAARAAVRLGNNSCFQNVDDYVNLTRMLILRGRDNTSVLGKKALQEAIDTIRQGRSLAKNQPQLELKLQALDSVCKTQLGISSNLETELAKLRQNLDELPKEFSGQQLCDICSDMLSDNELRYGLVFAGAAISRNINDSALEQQLLELFANTAYASELSAVISSEKVKHSDANKKGIQCYEQGQLKESLQFFEQAEQELPGNIAINLNYAQAILDYMDKTKATADMIQRCTECLQKASQVEKNDVLRFERYPLLKTRLEQFKAKLR